MTELETYVTKVNPNIDDWLSYNGEFFSQLKGENSSNNYDYAPFVDVDRHAGDANISTEDYFEQVKEKVGLLGKAAMQLVHSEADDAWHIIVAPIEETT